MVNQDSCLSTGLEEILEVKNKSISLEVKFYGEVILVN